MKKQITRRNFVKNAALGAAAATLLPHSLRAISPIKKDLVRVGMIGVGNRGRLHMSEMMKRPDVEVVAIADPSQSSIAKALEVAKKLGKKAPASFANGKLDYKKLLERSDVDAVIISTPWDWHLPQSVDAMKAGKAVGLEVAGAIHLEECWEYVETHELTRTPIMILENVCYRRDVMAVLNMVQQNRFGELLHLTGGYQHDLRAQLLEGGSQHPDGIGFGENAVDSASWRTQHYYERNGELYPTHQLGPIAMMLDINRGNRLTTLSSVASKARGFNRFAAMRSKTGNEHPMAKLPFKQGDIVNTMMQTDNGETILMTYDTTSPRPYNLGFRVQGTNGIWQDFAEGEPDRGMIYFEDKSPAHTWENPLKYMQEYDHPLWKQFSKQAEGSGHGGMDYFVDNAFIECIKQGVDFPLDVYDLATWYAISPLSEASIAEGGNVQQVPDFTKGKWQVRKPFAQFNVRNF